MTGCRIHLAESEGESLSGSDSSHEASGEQNVFDIPSILG